MNWPEDTAAKDTESPLGAAGSFATASRPEGLPQGMQITDHDLICRIGQGSYGEVWLARSVIGTYRAVKIVFRAQFQDAGPFEREFRGIQKFEPVSRSHDGLVDVLQVGRNDQRGYFYYVMEVADAVGDSNIDTRAAKAGGRPKSESAGAIDEARGSGFSTVSEFGPASRPWDTYRPHTLREELTRQGRLPVERCIEIGLRLTAALAHLHENGLVHRDIKPSNIIFVGGVPKLADIGLVADLDEAKSYVGTPGYIPPEGPGTPPADLYSLGKVLYEMATGRDRQEFPQLPAELREDSGAALLVEFNEILLKACEPQVQRRYQSAAQLIEDLRLLERGSSIKRKRALQRGLAVSKKAALVLGLVGVLAGATIVGWRSHGDGKLHSGKRDVDNLVDQANAVLLSQTPSRLQQAGDLFNQAVELDPQFPPAHIGVFEVRMLEASASPYVDSVRTAANLRVAASNLLRVAPHLAEAQIASACLKCLDGQWGAATEEARRATRMPVASKEGAGLVHNIYGWLLMNTGFTEEALRQHLLAYDAFPQSSVIQAHLGHPYFAKRDFKQALMHFQRSIVLEPRQYWAYYNIGTVYEELGDFAQAIHYFEQGDLEAGRNPDTTKQFYADLLRAFQQAGTKGYWSRRLEDAMTSAPKGAHDIAIALARLGRTDEAYVWLKKAADEGNLSGLWYDLCWDHNDRRFREIAKRVGLKP